MQNRNYLNDKTFLFFFNFSSVSNIIALIASEANGSSALKGNLIHLLPRNFFVLSYNLCFIFHR